MVTKSSAKKPTKPHPDFPLFPHATKRWAKKVKGRLHYFGPWDNPQEALEKWLAQKDDLLAGRTPRAPSDGVTLGAIANRFLEAKRHLVDTRELSPRTWEDYRATCIRLVKALGKDRPVTDLASDDFEKLRKQFSKNRGPVALGNEIQRVRILFKYAFDAGLIDRPVRYGPTFRRPSRKVLRAERHKKGERMLEPAELRRLIDAANQPMKAMILLALNCGYGNNDVGLLPMQAIDLDGGWATFPRPKTAVKRRSPLWRETVDALRGWKAIRPKAKQAENAGLMFVTRRGGCWAKAPTTPNGDAVEATVDKPVTKEFRKLLDKLGLYRPGISFYTLRHVAETIGGESRDQVAVDYLMGHAPAGNDMSAVYRERISDDRLRDVTDHVRTWLFGVAAQPQAGVPDDLLAAYHAAIAERDAALAALAANGK